MFIEKVQCIGFEFVLDAVGKTRRADEMQRHCPMQTDAQQPIEPDKMIHVGVRDEGMADPKELAGDSGVRSPRSNSSARRPKQKSMNSPGSEKGSFTRVH
jgi:hypothetical protein